MNKPKTGDLVYIIDPVGDEPIMMGIGLVVGETRKHEHAPGVTWKTSTPVLWNGRVEYLDKPSWMLEVLSAAEVSQGNA